MSLSFGNLKLRPVFKKVKNFAGYYIVGLYNRLDEHHVFLLAGGLAFSLFICIVPMTLIIFAVLGNILEKPSIVSELQKLVGNIIPYGKYAEFVENLVLARVDEFKVYKNVAGIIGLGGMLIASSGLFSSMRTILNRVYKVKTTQHAIIGKLRDLGLVILVMIYFLLSTTILPAFDVINQVSSRLEILRTLQLGFLEDFAFNGMSWLIIFIAFFFLYFLIPQQRIPKRVIALSALSASLLWEVAKQLFGFYIANMATLKRIYGAYSLIIITVFWIYYTSIVFIIAAEIGQLYRERFNRRAMFGE
jgi:membrane protein